MRTIQLLAVSFLAFGIHAQADVLQNVSINTSLFTGVSGYLDFQLNPAAAGAPSVTVAVDSFSSDGVLGSNYLRTGAVSGMLGSATQPLTLQNAANPPANEDAETFAFGTKLSFVADFSGTAISNPDPTNPLESTFSLTLYNQVGSTLLAQNYTVTPNGTVISSTTPEPRALYLLLTGLALLALARLPVAGFVRLLFRSRPR